MAILHVFCGKIAAGKSTLASEVEAESQGVRLNEDDWLSTLYPDEITSLEEFRKRSSYLEAILAPHLVCALSAGLDVVLDFHGNTRKRRAWMKQIIQESGCAHVLHILDVSDDICRQRLRERNAANEHAYQASDEQFDQFARYFEYPSDDEGFNVIVHKG